MKNISRLSLILSVVFLLVTTNESNASTQLQPDTAQVNFKQRYLMNNAVNSIEEEQPRVLLARSWGRHRSRSSCFNRRNGRRYYSRTCKIVRHRRAIRIRQSRQRYYRVMRARRAKMQARRAAQAAARVEQERLAAEAAARVEQERLAAEAAARAEQERLAAEAAARAEQERLAAEEAARAEQERLAAEEAARAEQERLAAEEAAGD